MNGFKVFAESANNYAMTQAIAGVIQQLGTQHNIDTRMLVNLINNIRFEQETEVQDIRPTLQQYLQQLNRHFQEFVNYINGILLRHDAIQPSGLGKALQNFWRELQTKLFQQQ